MKGVDCHTCTKQMKVIRGCEGKSANPIRIDDFQINTCPRRTVSGSVLVCVRMFHRYKNGFLPYEGTYMNQPMKIFQVFEQMESLTDKFTEKGD